jgi:Transposase DDE domain
VSQRTIGQIRDQIKLLQEAPQLPFCDLLDADLVRGVLRSEKVTFRDRVYNPIVTLWTFLSQVLGADHSCRLAVTRLVAYRAARGQEPCSPETGSYCKARQRLPIGVFTRLVRHIAIGLQERAPGEWLWKGREVLLVDGSTVSMPDTEASQRVFPQARTQAPGVGFPIARIVAVISLATGAVRDLAIGPYKGKRTGENSLFRTLWDDLRAGEIVLGDRHFASFFGIAPLVGRGVDGLFRMHQRRKYDFRRGAQLGIEDHVVSWDKPKRPEWMDQALHDQLPDRLQVRELRVRVSRPGYRVDELVLVTTMLDPLEYTKDELAMLYFERWNIELDLRSIKSVMQMDVLRCETPDMVEKEIWMHLLAYNLIRRLMAAAAEASGKLPRQVSFKGALQALAAFRDPLKHASPARRRVLVEVMLKTIAAHVTNPVVGPFQPCADLFSWLSGLLSSSPRSRPHGLPDCRADGPGGVSPEALRSAPPRGARLPPL